MFGSHQPGFHEKVDQTTGASGFDLRKTLTNIIEALRDYDSHGATFL